LLLWSSSTAAMPFGHAGSLTHLLHCITSWSSWCPVANSTATGQAGQADSWAIPARFSW
jgi:hypothetical protein